MQKLRVGGVLISHFERRGNRMTRGVIVPYGETPMEVEDIDEQYHDEL